MRKWKENRERKKGQRKFEEGSWDGICDFRCSKCSCSWWEDCL